MVKPMEPINTDAKQQLPIDEKVNTTTELENSQSQITDKDTRQWQRISPIALIYFVLMFFKGLFGNIIYIAPAILILSNKITENPTLWLPLIYGFIALILLSSLLSFYFFQYRLTKQHIEIRSGVFSKKYIDLPFSRIQNVELSEPLYYRPFGYCCLQLDTAGSSKQEAKVVALKKQFAQQLKAEILASHMGNSQHTPSVQSTTTDTAAHHVDNSTSQDRPSPISSDEVVIDRRNLDDLVIHGLTNNRVWIFLGGMAPFMEKIGSNISDFLLTFGINVEHYFAFDGMSAWQIASTFLTIFLMVMLVISIFSVLGSIISFHDFTLSKLGDRYIRRSGLFTRTEVSMRLSRLQMVVKQQDWLDLILRRINLRFEQSNANIQNVQPGQVSNKIIVPSVTNKECELLINDAYPNNQLFSIAFNRISKRYLLRNIGVFLLPIWGIFVGFFLYHDNHIAIAYSAGIALFVATLMIMRYVRWGYAMDDNFIYVRKGCLGVDYYCFPIFKVQQITLKQSWFLKRRQLCSLQFVLAAGAINIPYMKESVGYHYLNTALYDVEQGKRSWM